MWQKPKKSFYSNQNQGRPSPTVEEGEISSSTPPYNNKNSRNRRVNNSLNNNDAEEGEISFPTFSRGIGSGGSSGMSNIRRNNGSYRDHHQHPHNNSSRCISGGGNSNVSMLGSYASLSGDSGTGSNTIPHWEPPKSQPPSLAGIGGGRNRGDDGINNSNNKSNNPFSAAPPPRRRDHHERGGAISSSAIASTPHMNRPATSVTDGSSSNGGGANVSGGGGYEPSVFSSWKTLQSKWEKPKVRNNTNSGIKNVSANSGVRNGTLLGGRFHDRDSFTSAGVGASVTSNALANRKNNSYLHGGSIGVGIGESDAQKQNQQRLGDNDHRSREMTHPSQQQQQQQAYGGRAQSGGTNHKFERKQNSLNGMRTSSLPSTMPNYSSSAIDSTSDSRDQDYYGPSISKKIPSSSLSEPYRRKGDSSIYGNRGELTAPRKKYGNFNNNEVSGGNHNEVKEISPHPRFLPPPGVNTASSGSLANTSQLSSATNTYRKFSRPLVNVSNPNISVEPLRTSSFQERDHHVSKINQKQYNIQSNSSFQERGDNNRDRIDHARDVRRIESNSKMPQLNSFQERDPRGGRGERERRIDSFQERDARERRIPHNQPISTLHDRDSRGDRVDPREMRSDSVSGNKPKHLHIQPVHKGDPRSDPRKRRMEGVGAIKPQQIQSNFSYQEREPRENRERRIDAVGKVRQQKFLQGDIEGKLPNDAPPNSKKVGVTVLQNRAEKLMREKEFKTKSVNSTTISSVTTAVPTTQPNEGHASAPSIPLRVNDGKGHEIERKVSKTSNSSITLLEKRKDNNTSSEGPPVTKKDGTESIIDYNQKVKEEVKTTDTNKKIIPTENLLKFDSSLPNITPPALTCDSLGTDGAIKAIQAIRELSLLVSTTNTSNITESSGSTVLPSTKQLMKGISGLNEDIKKREIEKVQLNVEIKKAHEKEEKEELERNERQRKKEEEIEMKKKAQLAKDVKKELAQKQEAAIKDELKTVKRKRDIFLNKQFTRRELLRKQKINEINEATSTAHALKKRRLKKKIEEATKAEETTGLQIKKVRLEREVSIAKGGLESEETARNVKNTKNILFDLTTKVQETRKSIEKRRNLSTVKEINCKRAKVRTSKLNDTFMCTSDTLNCAKNLPQHLCTFVDSMKDSPNHMSDIISTILHENKRRAKEAHLDVMSIIPDSFDSFYPSGLIKKQQETQRNGLYTNNMARQVTGPGDALYLEPSQTPLYQTIERNYVAVRLLVREHVRGKKRKLFNRWTKLAQEYVIRQESNSSKSSIEASDITTNNTVKESVSITGIRNRNTFDSNLAGGRGAPYRRARRGAGLQSNMGSSDIVRSDYEQEQIIKELTAKDAMEKRIKQGGSKLPRQRIALEKELFCSYHDSFLSKRVYDPLREGITRHNLNPWTDMEKCIFLDRFLQNPKDFRKIASFLKNKSTHECIAFYYDSKQTVPYKAALKEHQLRKKNRGNSWEATIQATLSVGAVVTAGTSIEKPLHFSLPSDDHTFHTRHFHPMKREIFDGLINEEMDKNGTDSMEGKKKLSSKLKPSLVTSFSLDASQRTFLRTVSHDSGSDEESAPPSAKFVEESNLRKSKKPISPVPKIPPKWTKQEKAIFFDTINKHGKNLAILCNTVRTKTQAQIEKYYSDYFNKQQINNASKKYGLTAPLGLSPKAVNPIVQTENVDNQLHQYGISDEPPNRVRAFNNQDNELASVSEVARSEKVAVTSPYIGMPTTAHSPHSDHWVQDSQQQVPLSMDNHHIHLAEQQKHHLGHHLNQNQQLSQHQQHGFESHNHQLDCQRQLKQLQQQQHLSQHRRLHRQHVTNILAQSRHNDISCSSGHSQQMMSNIGFPYFSQAQVNAMQHQHARPTSNMHIQNAMALHQQAQHNNFQIIGLSGSVNTSSLPDNNVMQQHQASLNSGGGNGSLPNLGLLAMAAASKHQEARNMRNPN